MLGWTDEQINDLLARVHSGEINPFDLPEELFYAIQDRLFSAVSQGFGTTFETRYSLSEPYQRMYMRLQSNVSIFSAAKTFQEINDMGRVLYSSTGFKTPWSTFQAEARKIFDQYNDEWLNTEYNTAISRAAAAEEWLEIEETKDTFPLLQYVTVGDGNVRPEHAVLDGIIRPVDDPIWNIIFPPNGWNCRCIVRRINKGKITGKLSKLQQKDIAAVPKLFRNNPGKTGYIFDPESHPYFKVENRYKVVKQENFGLPVL